MTIRLKNSVTQNRPERKPAESPIIVVSAETEAACELGIPPVSTKRRRFQRPVAK
jgi:hypothetical protein